MTSTDHGASSWIDGRGVPNNPEIVLDTSTFPSRSRFDYWRDTVADLIGSFDLSDDSDNSFKSKFSAKSVGSIDIAQYVGTQQTMDRRKAHIKSSDNDAYIVLLESEKIYNLEHCGRQRVGRGGIVLLDNSQPYLGVHPEGVDIINLFIPRDLFERSIGPARHAAGLAVEATQPSFPIILAYLRSLIEHGGNLDAARTERMAQIAVELIATGFAEKMELAPLRSLSSAATLCRAKAYIANNLDRSGLVMEEVAVSLGLSVRRLQQIASEEGVSLVDWMWERRLSNARGLLIDPGNAAVSIGLIAYQCGFADQAHFARRYRQYFGHSPREARAILADGSAQAPSRFSSRVARRPDPA